MKIRNTLFGLLVLAATACSGPQAYQGFLTISEDQKIEVVDAADNTLALKTGHLSLTFEKRGQITIENTAQNLHIEKFQLKLPSHLGSFKGITISDFNFLAEELNQSFQVKSLVGDLKTYPFVEIEIQKCRKPLLYGFRHQPFDKHWEINNMHHRELEEDDRPYNRSREIIKTYEQTYTPIELQFLDDQDTGILLGSFFTHKVEKISLIKEDIGECL
jgi:hypothetical protein